MRTIQLCHGIGEEGVSHCVMAATSIVAGEEFSDSPNCVCPVITKFLVALNDQFPDSEDGDELRSEILGHLPWLIIGTRGTVSHQRTRAFILADFAVRRIAAFAFWKSGQSDAAFELWSLAPISSEGTAAQAANRVRDVVGSTKDRVTENVNGRNAADVAKAFRMANLASKVADTAAEAAFCVYRDLVTDAAVYAAIAAAQAAVEFNTNTDARLRTTAMFARRFVCLIERELVPVHTTMTLEPSFEGLVTNCGT